MILDLNGTWQVGQERKYEKNTEVPGLPYPADKIPEGNVWYKRIVQIPEHNYNSAALVLYGAKYAPSLYVDGEKVSETEGGMTRTVHPIKHVDLQPGKRLELEVCLKTVHTMEPSDASCLAKTDLWRGDLASHIWDDVELIFYNDVRIEYIVPGYEAGRTYIYYKAEVSKEGTSLRFYLYDGEVCIRRYEGIAQAHGKVELQEEPFLPSGRILPDAQSADLCRDSITLWSPDNPKLYRLVCEADGAFWEQEVGFKDFQIAGKHVRLNGEPVVLRMGSVVWHKCYRDEQFMDVAYDTDWFYTNIIKRLKDSGANTLRFHLGNPPRRMLTLCDRYGVLTQVEWSFFHDIEAAPESMERQYETWLGECLRHGSAAVIHPWNELDDQSKYDGAIATVEASEQYFPKFVLSHRDTLHIHAYWWSLFENLGLYYDSFEDFDKPVIADEFGGNYLDYQGEFGGYPHVPDAMRRFLGPEPDKSERIWLNTVSSGKIAEYWRRIGVAGFSPFCIMSSPQDGNNHFWGSLKNPEPMPVWEALKAAYQPVAASMDIWDRNFEPGEQITVPLHVFNDTASMQEVTVVLGCGETGENGERVGKFSVKTAKYVLEEQAALVWDEDRTAVTVLLRPFSKKIVNITYQMPHKPGAYTLTAAVGEAVSAWDILVHPKSTLTKWTEQDSGKKLVGILSEEQELMEFLKEMKISFVADVEKWALCDVILGMHKTYERLKEDSDLCHDLQALVEKGKKVILLSCGPMRLDVGYTEGAENESTIRPGMVLEHLELFDDLTLRFTAAKDGESHVHPAEPEMSLWQDIDRKGLWLWNGLRGGLIVPAVQMELEGVSAEAFAEMWKHRGADPELIQQDNYVAYECLGMYEFGSSHLNRLQERVASLLADAPALRRAGEPEIMTYPLSEMYRSFKLSSHRLVPLVKAGYALKRIPMAQVIYGAGSLVVSQMIFEGRLTGSGQGITAARRDPVARKLLLNLLQYI